MPLAPTVSNQPVLPTLQSLIIDGNFGISDDLLASLLAHAPQVNTLNLVLAGKECCVVTLPDSFTSSHPSS
jgi:hypothetical protein